MPIQILPLYPALKHECVCVAGWRNTALHPSCAACPFVAWSLPPLCITLLLCDAVPGAQQRQKDTSDPKAEPEPDPKHINTRGPPIKKNCPVKAGLSTLQARPNSFTSCPVSGRGSGAVGPITCRCRFYFRHISVLNGTWDLLLTPPITSHFVRKEKCPVYGRMRAVCPHSSGFPCTLRESKINRSGRGIYYISPSCTLPPPYSSCVNQLRHVTKCNQHVTHCPVFTCPSCLYILPPPTFTACLADSLGTLSHTSI